MKAGVEVVEGCEGGRMMVGEDVAGGFGGLADPGGEIGVKTHMVYGAFSRASGLFSMVTSLSRRGTPALSISPRPTASLEEICTHSLELELPSLVPNWGTTSKYHVNRLEYFLALNHSLSFGRKKTTRGQGPPE